MKSNKELAPQVKTACRLIVRTRIYFDLWRLYVGEGREGIIDAMRAYPEFFIFDEHAHRYTFFVHAAALLESNGRTINLRSLAREATNQGLLSEPEVRQIDGLLSSVRHEVKGINIIRNNAFAHRNTLMTFDEAFSTASLTLNGLQNLTQVMLVVGNKLAVACGLEPFVFLTEPRRDAARMLNALKG